MNRIGGIVASTIALFVTAFMAGCSSDNTQPGSSPDTSTTTAARPSSTAPGTNGVTDVSARPDGTAVAGGASSQGAVASEITAGLYTVQLPGKWTWRVDKSTALGGTVHRVDIDSPSIVALALPHGGSVRDDVAPSCGGYSSSNAVPMAAPANGKFEVAACNNKQQQLNLVDLRVAIHATGSPDVLILSVPGSSFDAVELAKQLVAGVAYGGA